MQKTLINSSTKIWVNTIELSDDWTAAEDEWQLPSGHEFVDGIGDFGHVWNGTQFIDPDPITEEEQAEIYWDRLRSERNALLVSSDWTQSPDSPLSDGVKTSWSVHRQELRDLPATTDDPANPTWPEAPE